MGGYIRHEEEIKQHPGSPAMESCLLIGTSRINDDYLEYIMDPSRCQIFSKLAAVSNHNLRSKSWLVTVKRCSLVGADGPQVRKGAGSALWSVPPYADRGADGLLCPCIWRPPRFRLAFTAILRVSVRP
ncbi:hypothetical protein T12_7545 [Trichinella patagoniensis]|uniref:Uncharacterized protein n=1 Tax=Trichinella patagoniensis TaxID=990121 RepID=A0A0V0ZIV3_9BILA|nr:hypothetical protein T12_7545 [Trichinella patagoniensis]